MCFINSKLTKFSFFTVIFEDFYQTELPLHVYDLLFVEIQYNIHYIPSCIDKARDPHLKLEIFGSALNRGRCLFKNSAYLNTVFLTWKYYIAIKIYLKRKKSETLIEG